MKNSGLKILSLLSFVFLISCVNEEYDLDKELKTEATLFENITVPVGNIKKITIDDLLFTDDAEIVGVTEDGDYFLDFISGSYESSVDIPSFSIEGMRLEDQTIYFNIPPSFVGTSLDALDLTIRYSDLVPGGLDFDMDIIVDSPMPEELIDPKSTLTGETPEMRDVANWYIDLTKFNPLCYDCDTHGYYVLGERVGNAFSDGKKIK